VNFDKGITVEADAGIISVSDVFSAVLPLNGRTALWVEAIVVLDAVRPKDKRLSLRNYRTQQYERR
jgi:hypothetical protein